MNDRNGPAGPNPVHYPDIVVAGDLCTALQARFDTAGTSLRVAQPSAPGWVRVGADVHADDRHTSLVMASTGRLFLLDCWTRGVHMAKGATGDLDAVAAAIPMFLSGVAVRSLVAAWPFLNTWGFAEAFEHGEPAAIEHRWRRYLQPPPPQARHLVDLYAFLTAAATEPRLRELFPFTSHEDLGVRRSIRDGHDRAVAWVRPFGTDRYLIAGPDRRQLYTPGPVRKTLWGQEPVPGALGPANAHDSVALVLTILDPQPAPTTDPTP